MAHQRHSTVNNFVDSKTAPLIFSYYFQLKRVYESKISHPAMSAVKRGYVFHCVCVTCYYVLIVFLYNLFYLRIECYSIFLLK